MDGVAITYDAIGNPLTDGEWTYTWQNGRQLARMQKAGMDASFVYNENGLRVQKTVNGVVTDYTLHGKNVVHMKQGGDELHFFYDAQNKPAVVVYNGTVYAYVKNLQGDIVSILDSNGAVVVAYTYDAWGEPIATAGSMANTLGTVQPFRYRSYCFDRETGLYYVSNRYYAVDNGRFVNTDSIVSGTGHSMFGHNVCTYCFNNPTNMIDHSGNWPQWIENAIEWFDENVVQPVEKLIDDLQEDYENYDVNNESEDAVFSSNYFSCYKGALVVKTSFDSSFSFGFIGLSRNQQNAEVLKHEYGHTVQWDEMGWNGYVVDVAIPSVTINMLARQDKLPYDYYSYPWEAEANRLGGSTLSQPWKPSLPPDAHISYWDLIQLFEE